MEREVKEVESEFQMYISDDTVRTLIFQSETAHCDHIFNRFIWGNIDNLSGQNKVTLWDDLKSFDEKHYSADQIKLVV